MPPHVTVRFFGELNELLPPDRREGATSLEIPSGSGVKDVVESLGVPHTEIDVILVDRRSVGFDHRLIGGEKIEVHPAADEVGVSPVQHLRPPITGTPRFVLDVHLGKLARTLRLLGFDAVWGSDLSDDELATISAAEGRLLLTKDRGLLKRSKVTHGCLVRETNGREQALEVLRRFDLFDSVSPFGRCLACNGVVEQVARDRVEELLPPRTRRDYVCFTRCPDCGRVYWKGSHYDRLASLVDDLLRTGRGSPPLPLG
jgi:uncharacterized protein